MCRMQSFGQSLMLDRPKRRQELGPHRLEKVLPPAPLQRANALAAPLHVTLHHDLPVRTVVVVGDPGNELLPELKFDASPHSRGRQAVKISSNN